ncbi:PREDICTED: uncharacterized protein LOC103374843 [Xyrichtys novacula]|uniref:PREDICTED: uncharacterized protein LOC103374843 n=1 Tax=Xyrichtys novacula TaxID=13765 RepID=A0AAV1FPZ4_XYRNO|nr:PREDICTED: uncharacterized protein LOC103374843 [Xyrichtys novacula]
MVQFQGKILKNSQKYEHFSSQPSPSDRDHVRWNKGQGDDEVVTPDGHSEEFDILAEVIQGDTLALFLFIIVLDYVLRKAISGREQQLGFTLTPRRLRRHPAVVLTDLDYADDISLLSDNVEQAQELLNRQEALC